MKKFINFVATRYNRVFLMVMLAVVMVFASCSTEHGAYTPSNPTFVRDSLITHDITSVEFNDYVVKHHEWRSWFCKENPEDYDLRGENTKDLKSTVSMSANKDVIRVEFFPSAPEVSHDGKKYDMKTIWEFEDDLVVTSVHTGETAKIRLDPKTSIDIECNYPTVEYRGVSPLEVLGEVVIDGKVYVEVSSIVKGYAPHSCGKEWDAELHLPILVQVLKENYNPGEDPKVITFEVTRRVVNCDGKSIDFYFTDFYSDGSKKENVKETYKGTWSAEVVGISKQYFNSKNLGTVVLDNSAQATPFGQPNVQGNLSGQQMKKDIDGNPTNNEFTEKFVIKTDFPVITRKIDNASKVILDEEMSITFNGFFMSETSTGKEGEYDIYPTTASFRWSFTDCSGDIQTLFNALIKAEDEPDPEITDFKLERYVVKCDGKSIDFYFTDFYSDGSKKEGVKETYNGTWSATVSGIGAQYFDNKNLGNVNISGGTPKPIGNPNVQGNLSEQQMQKDFTGTPTNSKFNENFTIETKYPAITRKVNGIEKVVLDKETSVTFNGFFMSETSTNIDGDYENFPTSASFRWSFTDCGGDIQTMFDAYVKREIPVGPTIASQSNGSVVQFMNGEFANVLVIASSDGKAIWYRNGVRQKGVVEVGKLSTKPLSVNNHISLQNPKGELRVSELHRDGNWWYWNSVEQGTHGARVGEVEHARYQKAGYHGALDTVQQTVVTQNADGTWKATWNTAKGVQVVDNIPDPSNWDSL